MKKILLLGGSAQQVVAIETAKRLGYYTVLCDFLPDNPGQYHADRFYLESTTDKETILRIAKEEQIDGILAYASDPAAPTAAYVSDKLNLPGNPYDSVEILCNKDRFRKFLSENGFNAPRSGGYRTKEEVLADLDRYSLPVIMKPVDSSGSKGATVLHSPDNAEEAAEFAFSFSRSHRVIVEEYLEKKHPYLIGGDVFVIGGKIVQWGLLNCHRDPEVNPLVPVGKSYPLKLEDKDVQHVREVLQKMVDKLNIRTGALNVELIVDKNDRVWPIDIGPRSGGNMIPDLLGYIFGVDIPELCVKAAMGDSVDMKASEGIPYYATHNLHTAENGIFEGIDFDEILEKKIIKKCIYKEKGDPVEYFDNAAKALGIIFMKFDTEKEMNELLDHIKEHITVQVSPVKQ